MTITKIDKRLFHYKSKSCLDCGKLISGTGNGLCIQCFREAKKEHRNILMNEPIKSTLYLCRNNCGNKVKRVGDLCKPCYDKIIQEYREQITEHQEVIKYLEQEIIKAQLKKDKQRKINNKGEKN